MIWLFLACTGEAPPVDCTRTWYPDADHDGWGTSSPTLSACTAPYGHADRGGDCADDDLLAWPGAPERSGNCADDDCDGAPEAGCVPSAITRVSVSSIGVEADRVGVAAGYGRDRGSFSAAISADGRYVAFASVASNLAPGSEGEGMNIFRRDMASPETLWVDEPATGDPLPNGLYRSKGEPVAAISGDGGRVAFWSSVSVDNGAHAAGVYARELPDGDVAFVPDATNAFLPSISADGDKVAAIVSYSAVGGACENSAFVVVDTDGTRSVAGSCTSYVRSAALSADGSTACLVVYADTPATVQRWDIATDTHTEVASSLLPIWECALSADGSVVVFSAEAALVIADTDSEVDVYAWAAGVTELVSAPAADAVVVDAHAHGPSISGDGRYVTFVSRGHLVSDDVLDLEDVYVRDRTDGTTRRVSTSTTGANPDGDSDQAVLSQDGLWIAFTSEASDLVTDDTNRCEDVFRVARP